MDLNEFLKRAVEALEQIAANTATPEIVNPEIRAAFTREDYDKIKTPPDSLIESKPEPEPEQPEQEPEQEDQAQSYETLGREDILALCKQRGITVLKQTRTSTLIKKLEELDRIKVDVPEAPPEPEPEQVAQPEPEMEDDDDPFPIEQQWTKAQALEILQNIPGDRANMYVKAKKIITDAGYISWAEVPDDPEILAQMVEAAQEVA